MSCKHFLSLLYVIHANPNFHLCVDMISTRLPHWNMEAPPPPIPDVIGVSLASPRHCPSPDQNKSICKSNAETQQCRPTTCFYHFFLHFYANLTQRPHMLLSFCFTFSLGPSTSSFPLKFQATTFGLFENSFTIS